MESSSRPEKRIRAPESVAGTEAAPPPGYRRDWKGRIVAVDESAEIAKLRASSSESAIEGLAVSTKEAQAAKSFEMVDMDEDEVTGNLAVPTSTHQSSRDRTKREHRSSRHGHTSSRDHKQSRSRSKKHKQSRTNPMDDQIEGESASKQETRPIEPKSDVVAEAAPAPATVAPVLPPKAILPPKRRSRWGTAPAIPASIAATIPPPSTTLMPSLPAAAASVASGAASSSSAAASLEAEQEEEKAKPNFGLTGVLRQDAATGNTYKGREMKFVEPPDAAMPSVRWRLHEFRGGVQSEKPLHIHRQTAFLFGKDPEIADILTAHPTCSRQHAVLQYRLVEVEDAHARGGVRRVVKPYIMDLESTNGTILNGERVDDSRYIELKAMDTLRFGESSREYVLLHDAL